MVRAGGRYADNKIFDLKGSGWSRRPKFLTEEGRLGQSYQKFPGRRKTGTGIDMNFFDRSINYLTQKEVAGAGADNQIFNVKGSG